MNGLPSGVTLLKGDIELLNEPELRELYEFLLAHAFTAFGIDLCPQPAPQAGSFVAMSSPGKKIWSKGQPKFWIKHVTALDLGQKWSKALVGNWLNTQPHIDAVPIGGLVVVNEPGTPNSKWLLAERANYHQLATTHGTWNGLNAIGVMGFVNVAPDPRIAAANYPAEIAKLMNYLAIRLA